MALILSAAGTNAVTRPIVKRLAALTGRRKVGSILAVYGDRGTAHYFGLVERTLAYRERFARELDAAPGGPLDVIVSPVSPLPALRHGAAA